MKRRRKEDGGKGKKKGGKEKKKEGGKGKKKAGGKGKKKKGSKGGNGKKKKGGWRKEESRIEEGGGFEMMIELEICLVKIQLNRAAKRVGQDTSLPVKLPKSTKGTISVFLCCCTMTGHDILPHYH